MGGRGRGVIDLVLARAFVREHWKWVGAGVVAFIVMISVGYCHPDPEIPERDRRSIDSLTIMKPSFDSTQTARAKAETVFVQRSARGAAVAAQTHESADSLRSVAIALQARAEATGDTLSQWRATALAWRRTADSLDVETDTLRSARDAEKAARLEADARAASERSRRLAAEDLIPRLVADVKGAKGGFLTRLRDRIGVQVGYGVQASADGQIHHGPTISAGVKVWP